MIITPYGIRVKVVYYGPGASGKTTTVRQLIAHYGTAEDMVELRGVEERTVFFDYAVVPLDVGDRKVLASVYTVAGQAVYAESKRLVLSGTDGVVFVADSSPGKLNENLDSLKELEVFCRKVGLDINYLPLVIQYNKRDVEEALPVDELQAKLNPWGVPHFESVATKGEGVLEPFNCVIQMILERVEHG